VGINKEQVREALKAVNDPSQGRDLVSLGAVRRVAACDGQVGLTLHMAEASDAQRRTEIMRGIRSALTRAAEKNGETFVGLHVQFVDEQDRTVASEAGGASVPSAQGRDARATDARSAGSETAGSPSDSPQANASPLPGVSHIVAVGAGKGGVGKSTVAVNLAVGLARRGHAVGLMDGDIYGPSIPTLMGLAGYEPNVVDNMIQPFFVHGVKTMSIGKLVDPEKPLVWRGPMAHGAFKQLAQQTQWGDLDYLIVDLPPGTGDVPLTMAQLLTLDGAVIVCTPQKVAQDDAVRAARMFQQLGVEVLGVIENMSYFIADDSKEYDIFGRGGAKTMADRLSAPFLGAVPINMSLREACDAGDPTVNFESGDQLADELGALAETFENHVTLASIRRAERTPSLTIS